MRLSLVLALSAVLTTGVAEAAVPVEADELLALPLDLDRTVGGLLAGADSASRLDVAPTPTHATADATVTARWGSAPRASGVLPAWRLPAIPIPLLPDDGLLFGLATSEDVQPFAGDLMFPRAPGSPSSASPARARAAPDAPALSESADALETSSRGEGANVASPPSSGSFATRAQDAIESAPVSPLATVAIAGGTAATLLGLLGFALYHRIRANATLENDTRKSIFDAVCANPGLGVHGISGLAGVSYSTATYHLERLVTAGMLVMTPDGNKLCYYKNGGAFTESERKILPILKNDEAAKLLEAILDTPGTYRAALADRLGVTATTINWHLRRLREAGLVHENRQGRNAYLYANADAIRTSIAQLATKLDDKDIAVADRLRKYVALTGGSGLDSVGPSSA